VQKNQKIKEIEMTSAIDQYLNAIGQTAQQAKQAIAIAPTSIKNLFVLETARFIIHSHDEILKANAQDCELAQSKGKDAAFIDRLTVTSQSLHQLATQIEAIAQLPDPVGGIHNLQPQPSGIQVGKMRVPLGVIGMIYESRPNVTVEAAALAIKSGNAIILRGGSEAIHTNQLFAQCISQALYGVNLPEGGCQLITNTAHQVVAQLLQMRNTIDVIIPRGGKNLVALVDKLSTIPVIKHLDGICHVYISAHADLKKAVNIALNAKTQRYGTCNTMETLLIDQDIAEQVFTILLPLYAQHKVELRGCELTKTISNSIDYTHQADTKTQTIPEIHQAQAEDWATEYLAPILSIKVVQDMSMALAHIAEYGSGHTESIVTENYTQAQQFLRAVDASSVMVNTSTRFADGFEYGLGAEIGISTNRLHVRGPVGLEGLTNEKYIVLGDGHVRQ